MSKLIFVDSSAAAAGNGFGTNAAFNGNAAGKVGIWSLDLGDHISGSAGEELIASGAIVPNRFMVTQGNADPMKPYASQIIEKGDVKSIKYGTFKAAAKASTAMQDITGGVTNSTLSEWKVVTKGGPVDYETFINPSSVNDAFERTGDIFSFSFTTDATATANEVWQLFYDNLNNNQGSPIMITGAGAAACELQAKNHGVNFLLINQAGLTLTSTGTNLPAIGASATYSGTRGLGDGYFVVGEEKKNMGYKAGFHNKLWFPQNPTSYAKLASQYDVITIELRDPKDRVSYTTPGHDYKSIEIYIESGATPWTTAASNLAGTNANGMILGTATQLSAATDGTVTTLYQA